jgi:hypothetical protein
LAQVEDIAMTALFSRSSPLGQFAGRYWTESRQPLTSLIFTLPLLAIYEAGVLVLGPKAVRNGAEAWLRQGLDQLGFGQYFLLPALTISLLLAWHYLTRRPWRVSAGVLYGMIGECVLLALGLWMILELQHLLMETLAETARTRLGAISGYLGAGIYEELLFRLLLLPPAAWALRRLGLKPALSMAIAVLLTSLLFALAHNIGANGETFVWFKFFFRVLAGIFFALLFVYRGFGIAAGTHAGYDILVGLMQG